MQEVLLTAVSHHVTSDGNCLPAPLSNQLRRADDFVRLAANAVSKVSGHINLAKPEAIGLFLGTAFGPIETGFRFLDSMLDGGENQSSPTTFSHSVHNVAAGYVAKLFNIRGPVITVTTFCWPFFSALQQALIAVSLERIEMAIVLTAEVDSPLIFDAAKRFNSNTKTTWQSGAVAWIIRSKQIHQRPDHGSHHFLINLDLVERICDPVNIFLRIGEVLKINDFSTQHPGLPMGYSLKMTQYLEKKTNELDNIHIVTRSIFGEANLFLTYNSF